MLSSTTMQLAADRGVVDALVFRRVSGDRWASIGGLGRGSTWAGLVEISELEQPVFTAVPASVGDVRWFSNVQSARIIGPYYAVAGALVRVSADELVVLGNRRTQLAAWTSEDTLRYLACAVAAEVEPVTPDELLAHELKIQHAADAVARPGHQDVWSILSHAADVASEALGCEVVIIRDGSGRVAGTSTWGAIDVCDDAFLNGALDDLAALALDGAVCLQDVRDEELSEPFDWAHGVRSMLAMPIPGPIGGLLVLAHTMGAARGFTDLCHRIAAQIAESIGILGASVASDALHDAGASVAELARAADATARARSRWAAAAAPQHVAAETGRAVRRQHRIAG